jgi:3-isopropylmalate/(R)-2-methylmalate dehydratase large subunit
MAHDGTAPVIAAELERHGITELRASDRAVFVFDHYYPPANEREATLHQVARRFAAQHRIPVLAGLGIAHQVLPERGMVWPGTIVVGADSHTCSLGAFGALPIGLGATDVAAALATGRTWLEVPELLRIRLAGELREGVDAHDLALHVVGAVGTSGALGRGIEFVGPGIPGLELQARFKLANHAVEMGAVTVLFGVDERSRAWLAERGARLDGADLVPVDLLGRDADVEIELARVERSVALPHSPDNVRELAGLAGGEGILVDQVFVGSCAGGRIEDLRALVAALGGRHVADGVRLLVGPASAEVLAAAIGEGLHARLSEAGATFLPPGCGACLGRFGALAPGEVGVATQNRNFVGRAGAASSSLYLASPRTAAGVALTGRLRAEGGGA